MRRKLFCTSFATLCSIIVAFFASITGASAQPPQNLGLCDYKVIVTEDVGCPIALTTGWSNGAQDGQPLQFVANYQFRIPSLSCPPAPSFSWFSVDGGITQFTLGSAPQQVNVNGCCMIVSVTVDANGYILIIISPCTQRAQNPGLCDYKVKVTSDVGCPITLTTGWSNGAQDVQPLQFVANYQFPIPSPNCPPAPAFTWVSVDGGITQIPLGSVPQQVIVNGCCMMVSATVDSGGYILIIISPC